MGEQEGPKQRRTCSRHAASSPRLCSSQSGQLWQHASASAPRTCDVHCLWQSPPVFLQ